MSQVTIAVKDIDLDEGKYEVDFIVEGSEIDDGKATAAEFTAFYLQQKVIRSESFRTATKQYGDRLVAAMDPHGTRLNTTEPATLFIILEDTDLARGMYMSQIKGLGGDPTGESLPTPAQTVGAYIATLLKDLNFMAGCWDFAKEVVQHKRSAIITNLAEAPVLVTSNDNADDLAA